MQTDMQTDMQKDMIVFGEDWGRHPSSTQHIMRRLACERRIMWVNSLGLRRPRLSRRDLARLAAKASSLLSPRSARIDASAAGTSDAAHPFTSVINPHAIPWPGSRLASAVNRQTLSRQIKAAMRRSGFERPVLWTSLPTALPVVGELGESGLVYYAGDDFGALAGVDHKPVLEAERRLAEKADLILAASDEIASRFDPDKTRMVPHGVDFDLFSKPAMTRSTASSKSRCSAVSRLRRMASKAASFTTFARSAPTIPGVMAAILSKSTSGASLMDLACMARIGLMCI